MSASSESVGASFAAQISYYALQVADGGNGTVTSSPSGINCSSSGGSGCSQSFAAGTSVVLSATAASGYLFSGWTGACAGTSTSCTLTMSAAQSVGATFAQSAPTAHYLQSDPYPLTGPQPDHFVVACDGGASANSAPAVDPSGARYLYYSLAGIASGAHTCTLAAVDATGAQSSAESVSFTL